MADESGGPEMTGGLQLTRRGRRWFGVAVAIALIATVVAITGFVAAERSRPVPDEAQRDTVQAATSEAVTALMTFGPGSTPPDRDGVAAHLTGSLLLQYRSEGPDVVLPGAVTAGASMSVRVVGVGVNAYAADQAQMIVFTDQTVTLPGLARPDSTEGEHTSTARWATMRNVGGIGGSRTSRWSAMSPDERGASAHPRAAQRRRPPRVPDTAGPVCTSWAPM
ncbi:hypothetical protein GTV32_21425 [Gordonia sp. SID5947]|uniref:hypothetical protein n=1 Tax=Gordonia sp. SID5947 TaxID=2690315 RepID=UPI00136AFE00|nr:hypothetical protein [Gordonia sp. SID5947]MYR08712.1 hypothetical protein [Gordonia sp. SID5947]